MKTSISTRALAWALSAVASGGLCMPAMTNAADAQMISTRGFVAPAVRQGSQSYIITFAETGASHYESGVAGLKGTAPHNVDGQRKFDVHSSAAQSYVSYLGQQRTLHLQAIRSALGRTLAPTHYFAITLNGIAARLDPGEAAMVAAVAGVQSVRLAVDQQVATYRGPKFIGADTIWNGANTPTQVGTTGRGIVVADVDAGTNSSHPSLADDATCGFRALTPKLVAADCSSTDINGFCHGPNPEANPGYGHGVHTSTTIAGNTVNSESVQPANLPDGVNMSGVAPCAAIHQYKVCETDTCDGASIVAAVQNAISDQVDVLNFSISGGTDPWNDNDRDFLDAVNADIFVAAAAGNLQGTQTDPHGLVNHLGPWVMTVAASTQDQYIGSYMKVTGPGTVPTNIANLSLSPGTTTPGGSIDQSGLPLISYPTNLLGCTASGAFPANYFLGAVAVVPRGICPFAEKITNAVNAGATRVLIGNNVAGVINMDTTGAPNVPAFSIEGTASDALLAFIAPLDPAAPPVDRIFANGLEAIALASGGGVGWYKHLTSGATQGDVIASFSNRGPVGQNATKPDISGPGVNIYAGTDIQDGYYAYMSGTSMATPHVTGAAALVRSVHPDWSVQEVKSALMMTASNTNGRQEDGVTPWIVDDVGSGRVDLTKATLAGLTMDETYTNFLAANPANATPLDMKALNVAELRDMGCVTAGCSWTRTVKNRLTTSGTWNITTTSASSFALSSSPSTFTLAPGATQSITFTAVRNTAVTAPAFGTVVLTEAAAKSPPQHLTVAIRQPPPPDVACYSNACSLQADNYTGGPVPSAIGQVPVGTFMWLNRFTPAPGDYPITLNSVQTTFALGYDATYAVNYTDIGDAFDVFIYQDNDTDPSNGATLVKAVLGQQITTQEALQTITIPGGVTLTGSGDILVAIVTRAQAVFPASVDDGSAFEDRSWLGALSGQAVSTAPDLSTLGFKRTGDVFAGQGWHFNWIIRAQGTNSSGPMTLGIDSGSRSTGK